jgi:hypothetical protein
MEISVRFTKTELELISKAIAITVVHSGDAQELSEMNGLQRVISVISSVSYMPEPLTPHGLNLLSRALTYGVTHTEYGAARSEMINLECYINNLASIPQTK